jgi:hypothetical protein
MNANLRDVLHDQSILKSLTSLFYLVNCRNSNLLLLSSSSSLLLLLLLLLFFFFFFFFFFSYSFSPIRSVMIWQPSITCTNISSSRRIFRNDLPSNLSTYALYCPLCFSGSSMMRLLHKPICTGHYIKATERVPCTVGLTAHEGCTLLGERDRGRRGGGSYLRFLLVEWARTVLQLVLLTIILL